LTNKIRQKGTVGSADAFFRFLKRLLAPTNFNLFLIFSAKVEVIGSSYFFAFLDAELVAKVYSRTTSDAIAVGHHARASVTLWAIKSMEYQDSFLRLSSTSFVFVAY
jgi:hypothetical protein